MLVGDQVTVTHPSVGDGKFEHAVEDHASAPRSAPVEAEDELVEVAGQVRLVDRTWMRVEHRLFRK
mgnify:CR=1 FL=1